MEISFCERCRESIPDADFDAGKAVRVAGRAFHSACAFQTSLPGRGRGLVAVLAVLATAAAAYAAVRVTKLDADLREDRKRQADVARSTDLQRASEGADAAQRAREAVRAEVAALRTEQNAALEALVKTLRADLAAAKGGAKEETEKQLGAWAEANQSRFVAIENRLGELADWIRDVRDLAKKSAETAAQPPQPPPAPPVEAPPAPPPASPTAPPPTDPAELKRRAAEVDRNIERLRDPSDTVVFSAAMRLGELGELRASPALVEVLKTHKYYYARLAAASSLGTLQSADAMPALIDALEDKDSLVQTAVAEAISEISGEPLKNPLGRSKKELRALKEEWQAWWKAHEGEVRARLKQPPA